MDDKLVEELVNNVRDSFAIYPKNDDTVRKMIAHGIRLGWTKGVYATKEASIEAIRTL